MGDPFKRTIKVEKCEIVIFYGHQLPNKPWKFLFPESCSAGGTLSCWPGKTNPNIKPENKIPGMPEHDKMIYWYEEEQDKSSKSYQERGGDEAYGNQLLQDARKNARKKAKDICKKDCCAQVTIYYIHNGSWWNPNDAGMRKQKVPKEDKISCGAKK